MAQPKDDIDEVRVELETSNLHNVCQEEEEEEEDASEIEPSANTMRSPRMHSGPTSPSAPSSDLSKKRIIFIRHAQSTWNHASEKSNVDRVSTLTKGLFESMYNKKDIKDGGTYIDAPLSNLGILQCMDLSTFIQHHHTRHLVNHILKTASTPKSPRSSVHSVQSEHKEDNEAYNILSYPPLPIPNSPTSTTSGFASPSSKMHRSLHKLHNMMSKTMDKKHQFVFHNIDMDDDSEDSSTRNAPNNRYTMSARSNSNSTSRNQKKEKLRDHLIAKDLQSLIGSRNDSCVLASNLRRAIDTAIIGLSARWHMFELENLHILSCLQEFGKGPDCITRTDARQVPKIANYTKNNKRIHLETLQDFYHTRIDATMNHGPKKADNVSRFDRMLEFCRFVFQRPESTIIVVGHSLWFMRFCKIFLLLQQSKAETQKERKSDTSTKEKTSKESKKKKKHIAVSSKLYNAGCVGFDLCRIVKGATDYYGIDARSMVVIYKGFENMSQISSSVT